MKQVGERALVGMLTLFAASVQAGTCTVSSSGMAFGVYQPLTFSGKLQSADDTSTATVSISCTSLLAGGSFTIALGPSAVGNSFNPRYLANANGGANMNYNIYTDAAYTNVWADGTSGALITGSLPVGSSNQSYTVFGRVPAGQSTLGAGSFSGSLTMTLTYNP